MYGFSGTRQSLSAIVIVSSFLGLSFYPADIMVKSLTWLFTIILKFANCNQTSCSKACVDHKTDTMSLPSCKLDLRSARHQHARRIVWENLQPNPFSSFGGDES